MKSNEILWSRLFKMKSNVFFLLNNLRMSKKSSTFAVKLKTTTKTKKIHFFEIFLQKNLRMSKKSSTFAVKLKTTNLKVATTL